ncbi:helix-turn-helix domain-containing protein [Paenibacillus aquistagni]|uniref:helix-turn-helix domain-containing protein n=1 Tax=Paenibacillus aquistagni TaxID=1852522 RepID=UPI00145BDF3E|nr:helix-turn-helix domain-containing protein [Paenibacillus aquistagni]NMM53590.1 AraC family transcriptional regulator [Paenibacillus aquistagni]
MALIKAGRMPGSKMTRRSVFVTIFLSYLSIVLIPVSIGGVFYQQVEQSMVQNAIRTNTGLMEQFRQITESRLQDIDQLTNQIAIDPTINWLLNNAGKDTIEQRLKVIDTLKELKKYKSTSSFIDDFFIYFQGNDTVLSPEMKADADLYFSSILSYRDQSKEWVVNQLLRGLHHQVYLPSEALNELNLNMRAITYVQSLPYNDISDIKGQLVVLIPEDRLRQMLTQIEGVSDGSFAILNQQGQILMSTLNSQMNWDLVKEMKQGGAYHKIELGGQSMIVSEVNGSNGWRYLSVIPETIVLKDVLVFKKWTMVVISIGLLAGLLLSYIMAYRYYQPLREVIKVLAHRAPKEKRYRDEYELIKQSVLHTMDEEEKLRQTLAEQSPVLKANFLSRLIRGHVDLTQGVPETFGFMGVKLNHPYYCVILIDIIDCSGFITGDTEREWGLARFVLMNLGQELLNEEGYMVELERDRLAVLLNLPDASASLERMKDEFLESMQAAVHQRFRMSIAIGVSSTHQGSDKISIAYGEAMTALDYWIIHGTSSLVYFEEIRTVKSTFYHYPIETEIQLMNLVKSGEGEQVERLLRHIFELNWQQEMMTPSSVRCLSIDLITTIMKILNSLQIEDQQVFGETIDPAAIDQRVLSIDAIADQIIKRYLLLSSYIEGERTDHHDRLYQRMKAFIEEHYDHPNLSLATMAEEFKMTPPYVSSFFKKYSGINITEYIATLRMEKSKEMLADRTLTLSEIAARIGYSSDVGFHRFFKKNEGITPGQYREMVEQKKES